MKPASTVVTKPPPATKPKTTVVKKKAGKHEDIEVYVEVMADTSSLSLDASQAETSSNWEGVTTSTPGFDYVPKGKTDVVSAVNGKFEIKGTILIQTSYGPMAKATNISQYGRGTTTEDEKSGNITLGFHESRHQIDYLSYLSSHALPEFTGKVGMTTDQFQAATDKFGSDFEKYQKDMEAYSEKHTDEVGYKRSQFLKSGPRP